jgi:hypothetical protein
MRDQLFLITTKDYPATSQVIKLLGQAAAY